MGNNTEHQCDDNYVSRLPIPMREEPKKLTAREIRDIYEREAMDQIEIGQYLGAPINYKRFE